MFIIKKAKLDVWGYEIINKKENFHNIAPTIEKAIDYLKGRYGNDVKYKITK